VYWEDGNWQIGKVQTAHTANGGEMASDGHGGWTCWRLRRRRAARVL